VLDRLVGLSRRKGAYVAAALLTVVAVVGTWAAGRADHDNTPDAPSAVTDAFFGTTAPSTGETGGSSTNGGVTTILTGTTIPAGTTTTSVVSPSTAPVDLAEVDRPGDPANPGVLYPGRPDLRDNDQERTADPTAAPARLSGYSVWIAKIDAAPTGPDGSAGPFLRITVRIVNRDDSRQQVSDRQWSLLRPDGVAVTTTFATPTFAAGIDVAANSEQFGELWFAPSGTGRYWISFRPDQASSRGVWAIDVA
jgi:hypothetical protein